MYILLLLQHPVTQSNAMYNVFKGLEVKRHCNASLAAASYFSIKFINPDDPSKSH